MGMNEYWKSSLAELISDMDLHLTADQVTELLEGILGIQENESLACGYDCIPNPMQTEVEELRKQIDALKSDHDRQLWGVKKGVAERRRVPATDVHIDADGRVEYDTLHGW